MSRYPGMAALALSLVSLVLLELNLHLQQCFWSCRTPAVDLCVRNSFVLNTTCVSPVTMVIAYINTGMNPLNPIGKSPFSPVVTSLTMEHTSVEVLVSTSCITQSYRFHLFDMQLHINQDASPYNKPAHARSILWELIWTGRVPSLILSDNLCILCSRFCSQASAVFEETWFNPESCGKTTHQNWLRLRFPSSASLCW